MKTKITNIKNYRENLTKLWKEARRENERIIVTSHSKPIFEVLPIYKDELELETCDISKKERYALSEKSFSFWKNEKDDNIFNEDIKI